MKWGAAGKGQWITVYTNPGHAYAVIAGLRLDTSAAAVPRDEHCARSRRRNERGPRWRPTERSVARLQAPPPVGF